MPVQAYRMGYAKRREIIRDSEFEEQLIALIPDFEEADDFTLGAEVILSLDPLAGTLADEELGIWILPMMPVRNPAVTLYYSFDETSVEFLAILAH